MRILLLVAVLLVSFGQATAGNVNGKIVRVAVSNGVAYIKTNPRPSPKPACATNGSWDYAFSVEDNTGKANLSIAITAHTTKAIIAVKSGEECTQHYSMEDVRYIVLEE